MQIKNKIIVYSLAGAMGLGALGGCTAHLRLKNNALVLVKPLPFQEDEEIPLAFKPDYPRPYPGNDPGTLKLNILQFILYDQESAYFSKVVNAYKQKLQISERPEYIKVNYDELKKAVIEWQNQKVKEAEARARIEEAKTERQKKTNVIVKIENKPNINSNINNTPVIKTGTQNLGAFGLDYDGLMKKLYSDAHNSGISIDDQRAVCNGVPLKNKEIKLVGTVVFKDCVVNPANKNSQGIENVVSRVEQTLKEENSGATYLFCGNASETLANKCSSESKDIGNCELSWKRALSIAAGVYAKLKNKMKNVNMAAYANTTALNERSTRVYLIKNSAKGSDDK